MSYQVGFRQEADRGRQDHDKQTSQYKGYEKQFADTGHLILSVWSGRSGKAALEGLRPTAGSSPSLLLMFTLVFFLRGYPLREFAFD